MPTGVIRSLDTNGRCLPEQGDRINKDDTFGTAESILKTFDFIAPANGLIIEVNTAILDEPFIINDDPFGEGWILKAEMEDEKDMMTFIRSVDYRTQFAERCLL